MRLLRALACALLPAAMLMAPMRDASPAVAYAEVTPGTALRFPRDYGSHPDFRTEWWYVTGWLTDGNGEAMGFQITFFRTKPDIDTANPSAFSPRQLLIAHCAISDPKRGSSWRDQRIQRAGFGLAEASVIDTDIRIGDWSLRRKADDVYEASIRADGFSLSLTLTPTQAPLLNGEAGVSRKGPEARAASYYYSLPQLRVSGTVGRAGQASAVTGDAWFDHEWSSDYLDGEAAGWDWAGINLSDGSALMAFRIRDRQGHSRWAGGTLRRPDGATRRFGPSEVVFSPGRAWISPRSGIAYPVEWRIRLGADEFRLAPLLDDQENDTRLSTGAIYWEGAVRAYQGSGVVGRGYLELTGYGNPLILR